MAAIPPSQPAPGRPRSEAARQAILNAVDDLLVEQGYAAMTMKGIAERAGVGRQTVYRWWSNKAEILVEACAQDAAAELAVKPAADSAADLTRYLTAAVAFLTESTAGAAYRALLGEAQHDQTVAELLHRSDVLAGSALPVIARLSERGDVPAESTDVLVAELLGPIFFQILAVGRPPSSRQLRAHVRWFLSRAG